MNTEGKILQSKVGRQNAQLWTPRQTKLLEKLGDSLSLSIPLTIPGQSVLPKEEEAAQES